MSKIQIIYLFCLEGKPLEPNCPFEDRLICADAEEPRTSVTGSDGSILGFERKILLDLEERSSAEFIEVSKLRLGGILMVVVDE